jgi:serine/threonine-protein kinase/endoribonuclease IRE1
MFCSLFPDLKPHNVLITEAGRAKLSDMGLSKTLVAEQSSFESHGAGGSSGWQAPEQLIARGGGVVRQTRSMDVFSLGCVLYHCLSGGGHPFGEGYERDTNILHRPPSLAPLASMPEAVNLVSEWLHGGACMYGA